MGDPPLQVSLARSDGCGSTVSVRVTGDLDPLLRARLGTMLDLL